MGHFGGYLKALSREGGEERSKVGLTLSSVVGVGGVKVGHPTFIGAPQHCIRERTVDLPIFCGGHTHYPEAQQGGLALPFCGLSSLHHRSLCTISKAEKKGG